MEAKEVHAWLSRNGRRRTVEGMARFGIQARQAYGVTMAQLLGLKRRIGKDHALALALWDSGWYEARLLAALVQALPAQVAWAEQAGEGDRQSFSPLLGIASARHEQQYSRLFRS